MTTLPRIADSYHVLARIGAIIHELTILRQQLEPRAPRLPKQPISPTNCSALRDKAHWMSMI
jgi:hypothetical protein